MAGNVTKAAARRAADEMVKSIGAPAKRNEDVSGVVKRIDPDGTRWVQLPGDEGLTPCAENAVESMMGDDVTVRIGNHSASIVKNNTKPPDGRTSEKVDEIRAGVGKFDELYASTATVSVLVADNADIDQLNAAQAEIERLRAQEISAQIVMAPKAQFDDIKTKSLESETGTFEDITVEGQLVANIGRIDRAEVKRLNADVATFGEIGAKFAHLDNGVIDNATIDHANVNDLEANYAHITDGVIDNATIDHANVNDLEANYAHIDAANIDTATIRAAWVDSLMVQTGLISHAGTIYELDAIQVNASKIKAGTLDVERLIVTVDGEKYLVHVNAQGEAAYQKLDGNIVEDLTITTDKLVAGAVTAQKITTENIVGSGGWINLRNGTFSYVNASSQSGISWDGTTLSITGSGVVISPSVRTPGRMTFYSVPTTPYDPDDRWESHGLTWGGAQNLTWGFAQSLKWGSLYDGGFVMVCQTARATGSFSASDWSVEAAFDSISDAAMRANNFITEVTGGGIMVHPSDDSTSGWKIAGAIELLKSGVSYIKTWLDGSTPKLRLGRADKAHVTLADSSMDVSDGSESVASFGSTARIGKDGSNPHFLVNPTALEAYDANGKYFTVSRTGMSFGANDVAKSADIPTKVSELSNDSSFATTGQVGTAKSEAISAAATDATTKANAAQSAAISAAAADATAKANNAAKTASNYITDITGGGIMVHPSDDSTSGWKIAGALEMLRSGVSYIWAGLSNAVAYVRVGLETSGNVVMSGDGYVDVRHGTDVMAHFGFGSGAAESGTAYAPYYTLGTRKANSSIGNRSVAEGSETTASGYVAHAEGQETTASGLYSHAEGYKTIASGARSHAEGGQGTASGWASHVEGTFSVASANTSHAEGRETKASSTNQHVQGMYNVEDSNGTYAHIVGNGSGNSRSNAHTIDWSGNAWFAGSVIQSSDRRLKRHLAYLGDEAADFIRSLRPALFEKDGARHVGLYAQDVQAAEPRSWRTDTVTSQRSSEAYGFDTLSLDYIAIIAPLIAYAQQLDARIEELESR